MLEPKIIAFRLVLALIFTGFIGWERESHERPAGFRTHILVGVGSTVIMIVSFTMAELYEPVMPDPGRIAAQVVSGIGFLGAGTIIRQGFSVKGLTTAASLWVVAAIGLAVGIGYYYLAVFATFLVFFTLFVLNRLEIKRRGDKIRMLDCRIQDKPGILGDLAEVIGSEDISINDVVVERDKLSQETVVRFDLLLDDDSNISNLNRKLLEIKGLIEFKWY